MGFDYNSRNLDHWMAIEIFRLPTTEFGKGICHMFLESSRQSLHKATKGNQRLGR